jgi:hypothetical protein
MQRELSAWKWFIMKRCTINFVKFTESSSKIKIHIFPHFISLLYSLFPPHRSSRISACVWDMTTWHLDSSLAFLDSLFKFQHVYICSLQRISVSAARRKFGRERSEGETRSRRGREVRTLLISEFWVRSQRAAWGVRREWDGRLVLRSPN